MPGIKQLIAHLSICFVCVFVWISKKRTDLQDFGTSGMRPFNFLLCIPSFTAATQINKQQNNFHTTKYFTHNQII